MLPEYTPYLNDAMARTYGNQPFAVDTRAAAQAAAEKAYLRAVKAKTPFYEEFGLPLGKGLKKNIKARYLAKKGRPISPALLYSKLNSKLIGMGATREQRAAFKAKRDLYVAALSPADAAKFHKKEAARKAKQREYYQSRRPLGLAKMFKEPSPAKKSRSEAAAARWEKIRADPEAYAIVKARLAAARAAKKTAKKAAGEGLTREEIYARKMAFKEELAQQGPAEIADTLLKIKGKLRKAKKARAKYGKTLALPGNEDKLERYRMMKRKAAKAYRQRVKAVLDKSAAGGACRGGLTQGRGDDCCRCCGGLSTGRAINARPAGGFVGMAAAAAAAAPLIIEGVRWIAKKIGERRAKGSAINPFPAGPPTVKEPKNSASFWRRVYKIASDTLPQHFTSPSAKAAIAKFMKKHSLRMWSGQRDRVLAKRAAGPLTAAEVLRPLLESVDGDPTELLKLPQLQGPAGSGVISELLSILKSPEVRSLASEAARRFVPFASQRLSKFIKGRLMKLQAKYPKVAAVVESTARAALPSPAAVAEPAATMTTEPLPMVATASGLGPASADSFTRGGRIASRVYGMAKKMPGDS